MTREEAIKNVKTFFEGIGISLCNLTKESFNTLIPELAESEDERIRKEMIEAINEIEPGKTYIRLSQEEKEAWIAYLEKQKEQKSRIDACGFPLRDEGESACSYLERCLAPDMRNIWYEACSEIKEKQKEQKPFWNPTEEDVTLFNKVVTTNTTLTPQERAKLDIIRMKFKHCPYIEQKSADNTVCSDCMNDGWDNEYMINTIIGHYALHAQVLKKRGDDQGYNLEKEMENWLREIVKPLVLKKQKPIISDEAIRDGVIHFGITQHQIDNWLKKHINVIEQKSTEYIKRNSKEWNALLAEQYDKGFWKGKTEQKPAEWSDEDKKWIDRACMLLNELNDLSHLTLAKIPSNVDEIIAHIKSLRPQSKVEPTLLNENIIEAAVAFVEQNDHFSYWRGVNKNTVIKALHSLKPYWKPSEEQMEALKEASASWMNAKMGNAKLLKSLYEQLKKLM